ncbi:MAG: prepilin-type N-terminal cleavage/methylation domain-containing protein [Candidatus Krumholzibacteriia bacterium]
MKKRAGYTIIELMIASFLALVVVLAMGQLILTNQSSWERGRDKVQLQANATEALEWMARQIRPAFRLEVPDDDQFLAYDMTGATIAHFRLETVGGENRLRDVLNGADLVARNCTRFHVRPDDDTTSVTLTLELENRDEIRVGSVTRAAIRNRPLEF